MNVSVGEVKALLRYIDSNKAIGYATIPPKLVKNVGNELAQPIPCVVNMSLSLLYFPHEIKSQRHLLYAKVLKILSLKIINHWTFLSLCPNFWTGS